MSFFWPEALALFVLVALLPPFYFWLLRRPKIGLKFADIGLIKAAVAGKPSFRRHVPPLLFFLALALMTLAVARPAAVLTLPSERATIMMAIDVSASMRAQDVQPSRMAAAQSAARSFVADQPRSVRIGLVAFSSNAMIAQTPTLSRDDLYTAIDRLRPQRYTAVGSGIVASLQGIFPESEADFAMTSSSSAMRFRGGARVLEQKPEPKPATPAPVAPGSYASAVIILLTDGQTNAGVNPLDAARMAADRGVRVFTVGFGTPGGGLVDFGGGTMRVQLDEETLKGVAEMTHARYFHAVNESDLKEIYKSLTAQLIAETKRTELTAMIAAPAMILLLLAVVLSLVWSNRMR